MLGTRHGQREQLALLAEVADGAYELAALGREDVAAARGVVERYGDLRVGLADASLVVLAERHGTADVLTFDHRHFRAMGAPVGGPFASCRMTSRPEPGRAAPGR